MGQFAVLGGSWPLDALALLMLVVAVASAARLAAPAVAGRSRRPGPPGAAVIDDAALVFMAVATAGMLVPGLRTLPDTAWEAVFAGLTTWFAIRSARAVRAVRTADESPAAVSAAAVSAAAVSAAAVSPAAVSPAAGGSPAVSSAAAVQARVLAAPNCAPHLVHCAAMLYMFLALPAAPGNGGPKMAGMPGAAGTALFHVLAVLGALVVVGYCARDVGHLSAGRYRFAGAVAAPIALLLSQATRVGCRAVMGVTMAVMLVIMT